MTLLRYAGIIVCLAIAFPVHAQQSVPPLDTGKVILNNISFAGNAVVRKVLVDSLNKQFSRFSKPVLPSSPIPGFTRPHNLKGLNDTAKQQFFAYVQGTSGALKTHQLEEGYKLLKDTSRMNKFIDDKLRGFYALMKDDPAMGALKLPGKPTNKLSQAGAEASYGDTTGNSSGWWNNIQLHDQVTVGSIPVNLQYANVSGYSQFDSKMENDNLVKFNFDKEAYVKKINAHLQKNYDLKKYFLDDIDFKSHLRAFVDERMKALKGGKDSLLRHVNADQLMHMDSSQLRNLVLNKGQLPDSALENYYGQLMQLKNELGGGAQMLNSQHLVKDNLNKWMEDPASTTKLAEDLIPMGGLQKILLKVKELNVGNIAANASKGTVSDLFMTGAAGSLLNDKNKFIMAAVGKSREMTPRDMGLNATMDAPAKSLQFLRLGPGDIGKGHTHISALNANARNSPGRAPNVMALAQNTFVGTFSKQLSLGEYGSIEAEFSKSANRTGGSGSGLEHAAVSKAAIAGFFDDFLVTASAGLSYSGEISKWRTGHTVYLNYSGLGYNNPGNPYSRRGMLQYGLNLKRTWLKNKASIQFRSDVKNMARSAVTGSQWKNYTFSLDGRYRVSRKLTFSSRIHQSKMNTVSDKNTDAVFLNRKINFSSQMNGKMWARPFTSFAMLGLQQLNYENALQPIRSMFINTQVSHSVMIGTRMVTGNLFYNRDLKNAATYSNLLNIDAGYHYALLKTIQCSSSLTFLDNKDVVRQIGVRQQAAAQLMKRFSVNVSVDLRKDLINTPQNYLYGNFRTEMSLHYQLN
ncbi:hypothetical protein GFS24_06485 [Chitinophaga sp. SYP-B3965]|uniref:hypothetical protein n=1 Tax=Chitinophaga sp. SYP-B3965 TaxID=2663120 RepID=UPI0012997117|nr:hypothetical protein [Chitinophaga sp. SYP-B3965]MRG44752.1 hypothetical protein [Chitinophaga sp. SYP-B3965]